MALGREIKVGAFVLAGLAATGGVIFLIGEERQLFSDKVDYQVTFTDVQGLRRGSPVRMGGVDIGTVEKVNYGENAKDAKIYVSIAVVDAEARRLRQDSVASIEGKGLLGDKMIVISVGDQSKPQIPVGGRIPSKEAEDMAQMISKLSGITTQVEKVVTNLERTSSSLADEKFQEDLKSGVASLSGILNSMNRGEGYVGRMLNDPAEAQRISQVVDNFARATDELGRTAQGVNAVLARVQNGPGLAHEVIYSEESAKTVSQFGGAADELRLTLKGIRDGNGIARSVIYGDDASQATMANLNAMSGDLRQIVSDVRAGKGTVGALLVDPSVYEDLKMVLGNVERNRALRALVRYSIKKDEKEGVPVREAPPAKKPAADPGSGPEPPAGLSRASDSER
ncbi:MAG TPA: MlaD family protein [Polyangiaceae bacterium]|jgi:phospholipid/cholesterol/gamma-HCH transport system substrate-binding protein|nr:MlaD family protein [Polyangiaceae bacterium]